MDFFFSDSGFIIYLCKYFKFFYFKNRWLDFEVSINYLVGFLEEKK